MWAPGTRDARTESERKEEMRRRKIRKMVGVRQKESQFKFLYVFYQWRLGAPSAPPPFYFSLRSIENRCSTIPDYFYPTFHYHNKTHAWKKKKKKINSKRQRGQKPGFGRLIFIFSFLSSILLCLLFSFRSEKWKETCLFFQPVPHYGAFQVCSFVWGRPRPSGAAGWITQTDVNTSTEPPTTPANGRCQVQHERYML